MRQLENVLAPQFRTIRFNAWRHEKAEEMWAAFALHFIKEIKPKTRLARWRKDAQLSWRQFDWASGWPDVVRVLAWFLALAAASITLFTMAIVLGPRALAWFAGATKEDTLTRMLERWLGPALGAGGWLAAAGGLATLWQKFFRNVKSPLEIDLGKYLRRPDYEAKQTFLERFQSDLRDATSVYLADGKKVFVFIDDLDRCELPQAAELMRAINLMLSDSGPIVFIIGMDREKIAAALAVKHEKLLPYLMTEARARPRRARFPIRFRESSSATASSRNSFRSRSPCRSRRTSTSATCSRTFVRNPLRLRRNRPRQRHPNRRIARRSTSRPGAARRRPRRSPRNCTSSSGVSKRNRTNS